MTTGEMLYLAMAVGGTAIFLTVLAWATIRAGTRD